jgi:hypothetical protein
MSPQLGGNWTTFSTLFYKPCFETSMNGFYQLSVFSLPENIARRQLNAAGGCKVQ